MRLLSEHEISYVSGGMDEYSDDGNGGGGSAWGGGNTGGDVVVTAPSSGGFGSGASFTNPGSSDNGNVPTVGGGAPQDHYATPNVSAAANHFADQHVHKDASATSDHDEHVYELAHDQMAKFYEYANKNPNAPIDIGKGHSITASEALSDLSKIDVLVTQNGGGPTGGNAPLVGDKIVATINPENSNVYGDNGYDKQPRDTGLNYLIAHEVGHGIEYFSNRAEYSSPTQESSADAAARSMESAMGLELMGG